MKNKKYDGSDKIFSILDNFLCPEPYKKIC